MSWRMAGTLVGALCVVAGLFAYQLGLSASRSPSTGKAAMAAAGLAMALAGTLGWKTLVTAYKACAILVLNTVLLLVLTEFGLTAFARLGDFFPRDLQEKEHEADLRYAGDRREELPYFREQDWAKDHWREYHAAWDARTQAYRPYLVWRIRPFTGRTLNVGEDGLRVTPGAECVPGAYKVFAFGGSAMWGTGAPDWGTIPAFLQSKLGERSERATCVVNYGEQAYVSTQETIQLLLLLRSGEVPDLALFYDGVNDVLAAYETGVPGTHYGLRRVAARLEDRREVPPLLDLVSATRTYKLWTRLTLGERRQGLAAGPKPGVGSEDLASGIARTYLGNTEAVEALAAAYGFRAHFFWQPSLLTVGKPLTEEESGIRRAAARAYPGAVDLQRRVDREIAAAARNRPLLHDLAGVFQDEEELVFIDPFHVTMAGNESVADAMLEALEAE